MSAGYVPGPGNDSSGVRPNLSFTIDGEEYYTSGNIAYNGIWVKKGFVYKTKLGQTSMNVTIRNNAPGGGGNDWAIDDIAIATCLPNMKYSPSITPTICSGNAVTIYDTVRSFFNNYVYYKWQRSTNGGASWSDVTVASGPVIPFWNGTAWQYVSSYTIPPAFTTLANSGDKYRLVVATSLTNLTDVNCRSTDPNTIVTLNVINCGPPLSSMLTAFTGKLVNNKAILRWTTTQETQPYFFDIEKSLDGNNFSVIGTVNSNNDPGASQNNYAFQDPVIVISKAFYRISIRAADGQVSYSRVLPLSSDIPTFSFGSVINPFVNDLLFDITSAKDGLAKAELIDQFGKPVKSKSFDVKSGTNQLTFDNTGILAPGVYILRVELTGTSIYRRVVKQNH
jgi:hypothetical protein